MSDDLPPSRPQLSGGDDAPCTCPAIELDEHTARQHTTCGMSHSGGAACGGCHDCMSAQLVYYAELERRDAKLRHDLIKAVLEEYLAGGLSMGVRPKAEEYLRFRNRFSNTPLTHLPAEFRDEVASPHG